VISRSAQAICAAVPRSVIALGAFISEYPLDFGRRANLGSDLLKELRAFGAGQEEDTHDIVDGTGRAIFVRGRSRRLPGMQPVVSC
jgi:hypothetical protein